MILGIDPGLNGGLALITTCSKMEKWAVMPRVGDFVNLPQLSGLLKRWSQEHRIDIAVLEQASARPLQGVCSMFKFGRVYGALEALLSAHQLPYQIVAPRTWSKEIHAGVSGDNPKEKSRVALTRLFPGADLRETPRCKKPHEGVMDAVLIAEYGRRCLFSAKETI